MISAKRKLVIGMTLLMAVNGQFPKTAEICEPCEIDSLSGGSENNCKDTTFCEELSSDWNVPTGTYCIPPLQHDPTTPNPNDCKPKAQLGAVCNLESTDTRKRCEAGQGLCVDKVCKRSPNCGVCNIEGDCKEPNSNCATIDGWNTKICHPKTGNVCDAKATKCDSCERTGIDPTKRCKVDQGLCIKDQCQAQNEECAPAANCEACGIDPKNPCKASGDSCQTKSKKCEPSDGACANKKKHCKACDELTDLCEVKGDSCIEKVCQKEAKECSGVEKLRPMSIALILLSAAMILFN